MLRAADPPAPHPHPHQGKCSPTVKTYVFLNPQLWAQYLAQSVFKKRQVGGDMVQAEDKPNPERAGGHGLAAVKSGCFWKSLGRASSSGLDAMIYSTLLEVKDDLERTLLEEDQALQSSFRADQGLQGSSWSMWTLQANLCVHHSHPWIRTEDRETVPRQHLLWCPPL